MSELIIRPAREEDSPALRGLWAEVFGDGEELIGAFFRLLWRPEDCAVAAENMMLAAFSLGVGSCWINQLYRTREDREVQEKLAEIGVTPEEMPVAALALGWPAVDFPGPREKTGNLVSWVR